MKTQIRKGIYIAILLLIVWSVILFIFRPEERVGPFGLGLPSKMKLFTSKTYGISIRFPESWVAFETPDGEHGDREVIIRISVPGRTWPFLSIARQVFTNSDLDQVTQWGLGRIARAGGKDKSGLSEFKTPTVCGKSVSYTYSSAPGLLERKVISCQSSFFLDEEKGYMISFCSEANDWEKLVDLEKTMLNSLVLH